VVIEHVRIADFTGDGIIISNGGEGYRPSECIQAILCDMECSYFKRKREERETVFAFDRYRLFQND
ncbi:hypothetical protein, partial [Bacillus licheniformis]|uniref:hypothetical protein n=1 Tax=Bacillus licheniformis TaxID=1402 RepID=UPI00228280D7